MRKEVGPASDAASGSRGLFLLSRVGCHRNRNTTDKVLATKSKVKNPKIKFSEKRRPRMNFSDLISTPFV